MNTNPNFSHPNCPFTLTAWQREQFKTEGYLAFNELLSPEEVEEGRKAISDLIELAKQQELVSQGRYSKVLKNKSLWIQLEEQSESNHSDNTEFEFKVRKIMRFHESSSFMNTLAKRNKKIIGILESIIGRDPIMFQDMALIKPPFIGSEKPWHQDNAYFSVSPLNSVVGVWIALDPATVSNGCMHLIPKGHLFGPMRHHHTFDCEILAGRIDPSMAIPVELPAGGALFFYGLLPHQTPPNASPDRRRALQFHYRSRESKVIDPSDYDLLFCEADGTPASCASAKQP